MTITEFLEARVSEDEAAARAAFEDGFFGEDKHDKGEWEANTSSAMPNVDGAYMNIMVSDEMGSMNHEQAAHIARHDPARVLAECAAKRAIIKSYRSCVGAEAAVDVTTEFGVKLVSGGMVKGLELAVKYLAAVYADHPDYRQAWAL